MSILDQLLATPTSTTVEISSNVSPPVVADAGASSSSSAPGLAGELLRLVKPSITVRSPLGTFTTAPYGEPDANAWKWTLIAGGVAVALVAGLAGVGAATLLRKARRT